MRNQLWDRFDSLVERHAPSLFINLNAPASIKKIEIIEAKLCQKLPEEFRTAHLRHDGCKKPDSVELINFFQPYFRWMSLDEIVDMWIFNTEMMTLLKNGEHSDLLFPPKDDEIWQNKTLPIRPEHANSNWIPIAKTTDSSPLIFIDMQPGPSGQIGQLITWGATEGPNLFVFSKNNRETMTFGRYILALCEGMENGSVTYDEHGWNIKE
ncbi:MAG: SMI1/KNR4 family protein [Burkholderiaceae bacterium]|nr:SMI1/KNR4 family protein [Burkholderiaceae bacterium]